MAKSTPKTRPVHTEIVYSCGVSLDGYIAALDGGVDWLHGAMVKGESYGLAEFMRSIDAVLMGSRTYEHARQMGGFMGSSKPCWVFSRRALEAGKGVKVTAESPRAIVESLPAHGIRRAWLMGGGLLASSFLEQGLIDEVGLGVMPVVLGAGIPVFGPLKTHASLRLVESKTYKGGALGLRYEPARRPTA